MRPNLGQRRIWKRDGLSVIGVGAWKALCVCNTDSRRRGITTGPPPNMIVPARYKLANKLNPRGLLGSTPRKIIIATKVIKNAAIIAVPNFQENTLIFNASGTIRSCSSSRCEESFSLLLTRALVTESRNAVVVLSLGCDKDVWLLRSRR